MLVRNKQLIPWCRIFGEVIIPELVKGFSVSQWSDIKSSLQDPILNHTNFVPTSLRFSLILLFYLRRCLPRCLFLENFRQVDVLVLLLSTTSVSPTSLAVSRFNTLTVYSESCKVWRLSVYFIFTTGDRPSFLPSANNELNYISGSFVSLGVQIFPVR
jgi:hypothetical protein